MTVADRTKAALETIAGEADWRIFLAVDEAGALEAAAAADARGQPSSSIDGKLIAVKANLAIRGLPWSAAIEGWRDRMAAADADVVKRLRQAGAVVVGAVNMDEGALGAVTAPAGFGPCINPLDPVLTPGGSSGGSAAAVAAGLVDAAIGTDTLGSVRIPAAYCGVVGLKTTDGLVDRAGLAFLSPSFDTIGPIATRVPDLWDIFSVMVRGLTAPDWGRGLAGLKFAVPRQIDSVAMEPQIQAGLAQAIGAAESAGAAVAHVDLDGWEPGPARRGALLVIEHEGAQAMADLLARPGPALSDKLRSLLEYGKWAAPEKLAVARGRVERAAAACHAALATHDAILMPTAPQRAFPHGTAAPDNQADLSSLANFAGCPSVSVPVPLANEGLPAAVQLVGAKGSDSAVLAMADALYTAVEG